MAGVGTDDESTTPVTSTEGESTGTDSGTESETGDGDGDGDGELPEACALVRVEGDARIPITPDLIGGLRLATLEPGTPSTPARVLTIEHETYGSGHGEYRARSFVLEPPWPEGVVQSAASLQLTSAGHSVSRLASLAPDDLRFAFIWTGDPDGINDYDTFFSILDAEAWTVGDAVEIESSTNPGFVDLLATPSQRLLSTYTTDSYATTPDDELSGFSLGVLEPDGTPVVAATPLIGRTPAPGSNLRSFWAGDRVAVAIGHNDCDIDEPLCIPHAVVLARPTEPDREGVGVDGYLSFNVFVGLPDTSYVSRPQISAALGHLWLTWYEGADWTSSDEHRTFRAVVLDASGEVTPWPADAPGPQPFEFLVDTAMDSWPTLQVSEFGVTVGFRTAASTFEIHNHDFELQPLGEPIVIELDSSSPRYPAMTVLAHPRSLLLAWEEPGEDEIAIRMVRLECG